MQKEKSEQRYARWRQLVEEQNKSGMTRKIFCKQHNISLSQFIYYNCLLKNKDTLLVKKSSSFAPVKISDKNNMTSGEIKLLLPNGFNFTFPSDLDVIQIKRLVEVLLTC
jgi:hypothetical protein